MSQPVYDKILAEVLDAREDGRALDLAALVARYPEHESTARRVFESVQRYDDLLARAATRRTPLVLEALEPGERLGDFEVVSPLARGGMGVVYRARQLSLGGRIVALKVLAEAAAGAHGVARFEREALALAELHHDSLAEVYGFGAERGSLFIAMRLVGGTTLRDVLERRATRREVDGGASEFRELVLRVAQVADALALVHRHGLVHRDVKPSNIVLEGTSESAPLGQRAVLVDFGLARRVDSHTLTMTGESPATPSYAPPEQLLGQDVDARADVFSLGVTLHDLLAARRPTERSQASAGLEPIRELAPQVDQDLAAVIARCVDPEARWRYPNAGELQADLRAWLAGEAVSARATPLAERARRWMARHPRRIVQGTLAAAAAVSASVLLTEPMASIHELRGARGAYERGDLRELERIAAARTSFVPTAWVTDAETARVLERVGSRAPGDRWSELRDMLARDDLEGALFAAAETIGTAGAPPDPLFERFFLGIANPERNSGPDLARLTEFWSLLVARLYYEQPVESVERERSSAPFRAAVLSMWRRAQLGPTARGYLVTALGHCGQPRDVSEALLPWLADDERGPEELRLGLRNLACIVRRAHGCGRLGELPFDELWSGLRRRSADWLSTPHAQTLRRLPEAAVACCEAVAIAERAVRGRTSDITPLLPGDFAARMRAPRGPAHGEWLPLAALGSQPELLALLERDARALLDLSVDAKLLGRMCAFLGEPTLAERVRGSLLGALEAGERSAFEAGLRSGRAALTGLENEFSLSRDSLLGALHDPALHVIERSRRASARTPWLSAVVATTDEHSGLRVMAPGAYAWWLFLPDGAHWGAAARGVSTVAAAPNAQEFGFLLLQAFGRSKVELTFRLPRPPAASDYVLVLEPQSSGRDDYPNCGLAEFSLHVNGHFVGRLTWQFHEGGRFRDFDLPARNLRQGDNLVEVRLLESSTTPLRLRSAAVWTRRSSR